MHARPTAARLLVVAATSSLLLGGCGGSSAPDHAQLQAKLKAESGLAALTPAQLSCVTDVLLTYGKAADLKAYVDGSKKLDEVKGTDDAKAQAAGSKCATAK